VAAKVGVWDGKIFEKAELISTSIVHSRCPHEQLSIVGLMLLDMATSLAKRQLLPHSGHFQRLPVQFVGDGILCFLFQCRDLFAEVNGIHSGNPQCC
jgi:hypothetical protein